MRKYILLSLLALTSCNRNLSGTYALKEPDSSLDIVKMVDENGKITGRYVHVFYNNGKLQTQNAVIDASENDGQIVGTLKPAAFLSQTIPISGHGDGYILHIDGQASLSSVNLDLQKISDTELRNEISNLR